jgi:hypothetical protein
VEEGHIHLRNVRKGSAHRRIRVLLREVYPYSSVSEGFLFESDLVNEATVFELGIFCSMLPHSLKSFLIFPFNIAPQIA